MKSVSKVIEFPLSSNKKISVNITKKRMKNMRLGISKMGIVSVSIPYSTTYSYAYQFLVRKRDWIISQLKKINSNLEKDSCHFENDGNIFILGENYPLIVNPSDKNKVIFNKSSINNDKNNCFEIYTKDTNPLFVKQLFIRWCKKYFLDFFTNRLNFMYSQIFKNLTPPPIKLKTMKSMWGNCNYVKKVVTLNLYLAKTPIECIDYVIIHELAHLIHHNHGKEFHNLMDTLLPDWKARKKMLNNYSLNF